MNFSADLLLERPDPTTAVVSARELDAAAAQQASDDQHSFAAHLDRAERTPPREAVPRRAPVEENHNSAAPASQSDRGDQQVQASVAAETEPQPTQEKAASVTNESPATPALVLQVEPPRIVAAVPEAPAALPASTPIDTPLVPTPNQAAAPAPEPADAAGAMPTPQPARAAATTPMADAPPPAAAQATAQTPAASPRAASTSATPEWPSFPISLAQAAHSARDLATAANVTPSTPAAAAAPAIAPAQPSTPRATARSAATNAPTQASAPSSATATAPPQSAPAQETVESTPTEVAPTPADAGVQRAAAPEAAPATGETAPETFKPRLAVTRAQAGSEAAAAAVSKPASAGPAQSIVTQASTAAASAPAPVIAAPALETAAAAPGGMPAAYAQSAATVSTITTAAQTAHAAPVAAQIGREIIRRFDGETTNFEMRLDPPELGRVEIRLEVSRDHRVTAVVLAENPQALADLSRSARELEQALQSSGLELSNNGLSFDLAQRGGDSDANTEGGGGRRGGGDAAAAAESPPQSQTARPIGLERWRGVRVDLVA